MKRAERALLTLAGPDQSASPLTRGHVMATAKSTVTYRDVPGYTGYRVGDDGTVWTCWEQVSNPTGRRGRVFILSNIWHPLALTPNKTTGRIHVRLARRTLLVHRLVLEAFVGPCPEGLECCHEDGDPMNNTVGNLRWGTRESNYADSVRHGTRPLGERHALAKLTDDIVRKARLDHAGGTSLGRLSREHGVSLQSMSAAVRRKTWKHVS